MNGGSFGRKNKTSDILGMEIVLQMNIGEKRTR